MEVACCKEDSPWGELFCSREAGIVHSSSSCNRWCLLICNMEKKAPAMKREKLCRGSWWVNGFYRANELPAVCFQDSACVIALLKYVRGFPSPLGENFQASHHGLQGLEASSTLVHYSSAPQAFLLLLELSRLIPVSGPLHLLCPQPGKLLHQLLMGCLLLSFQVSN